MSRGQLLLRLLLKAAWVRKDRALTALVSVAVVATIATAALTIYYDLENKLSREFRDFGANVVVTARSGELDASEVAAIASTVGANGAVVPVGYAIVNGPSDRKVVLGGADLKSLRELNSWWSIRDSGQISGNALLGGRAAQQFSPQEQSFRVSFAGRTAELRPAAIFNSGSDDDSRIYIPLQTFSQLTGVQLNTALVRVAGPPREVQQAIDKLTAALPRAEVKPVRQITQAQVAVVGKTRSVVLTASLVVLVLIMLCMAATFTSSVLERRKDFAVMKALGASNRTVNVLFASESAMLALAGAAAGYILGSAIAFWIGKVNFDAAILPDPFLLLPVLLGSILVALLTSTVPLRMLQQIQPARILRGE